MAASVQESDTILDHSRADMVTVGTMTVPWLDIQKGQSTAQLKELNFQLALTTSYCIHQMLRTT
jgi:hypothetical protein